MLYLNSDGHLSDETRGDCASMVPDECRDCTVERVRSEPSLDGERSGSERDDQAN
jgi:hypothetical protein